MLYTNALLNRLNTLCHKTVLLSKDEMELKIAFSECCILTCDETMDIRRTYERRLKTDLVRRSYAIFQGNNAKRVD